MGCIVSKTMIEIKNLNKYYGKQHVLKDINLKMDAGQCIAFVGPNGCGKTTLMKCILGLVTPQSGEVLVDDEDVRLHPECRQHIGFMPQNSNFPENMSVRDVFHTLIDVRGQKDGLDKDLLDQYEIKQFAAKRTGALSGGMRQKVNAALAFLFHPDILILDEPTASLDPLSADMLKEKIRKEKGKLVFITSHILSELNDLATHIIFMDEGKILFYKSVEQLLQDTSTNNTHDAVIASLKCITPIRDGKNN